MRRLLAGLALLGCVCAAHAGDGYAGARPFTWTGLYIGGHGGLATGHTSGRTDLSPLPFTVEADYDMNGGMWGGHIGYNYQVGHTVVGMEGTWSNLDMHGNTSCTAIVFPLNCSRSTDWLATVVGRVGLAMDRAMVYGLGGVAWGKVETEAEGAILGLLNAEGSATHVGWVAGIGVEYAVTPNILARVEYNHIDLGSERTNLDVSFGAVPLATLPSKVDLSADTIKVGVSWKFN